MTSKKVVFMGTPAFALPSLQALLSDPGIDVAGVMTQPDRPAGRGNKLTPPPVKVLALESGLTVKQPVRLRKEPDMIAWLRDLQPDFLVTAAFGQILPQEVLDIPKFGTVNVHASLLPSYRGPNPVQWCIINGDAETGVTLMLTELGVDTGPMLNQARLIILPEENAAQLTERLAQLGADILCQTLRNYADGKLQAQPQDEAQATHAPKLSREDAWIDWTQPAERIHDKIRGQYPWPGTQSALGDLLLKIYQSRPPSAWPDSEQFVKSGQPGQILSIIQEGLVIGTGSVPLLVETVQPPGKPKMAARDWANGALQNISDRQFTGSLPSP